MRAHALWIALVAALVVPAGAQAGGWATVGVDSQPAGGVWTPELTVLQHGRTPLEGVSPAVLVTGPDGVQHRFAATPTDRPGVYRARVVFSAAGAWEYAVDDGFGQTHTFAPVTIGAAAAAPQAADDPGGSTGWIAALGVVLGAAVLLTAAYTGAVWRSRIASTSTEAGRVP